MTLAGASCGRRAEPGNGATASASTPVVTSAEPREDVEIRPVYPPLTGPVDPRVERLCDVAFVAQERKRAACCGRPPTPGGFEKECARNLQGALGAGAVTLEMADVERCAAATDKAYEACDWVTAGTTLPPLPPECSGIVKGKLAAGTRCRSSLECTTGLACQGVGPTTQGTCAPPRERGACRGSSDVLIAFTRDDAAERDHRECKEACQRRRCGSYAKAGEECASSAACAQGLHCEKGRCAAGDHAKAGAACGDLPCDTGLRCIEGKCAPPRKEGDTCRADGECRGTCVKAAPDGAGTCTKVCNFAWTYPTTQGSARPLPSASAAKPDKKR